MLDQLWVIVLAGGEGSRLGDLARDESGMPAPKQFCRFGAERSLLDSTLARARGLVPGDRIVVSVIDAHRRWWAPALADHPFVVAISQPWSRGTAAGVLAPLLRIHRADPSAHVVILPSDQAVVNETILLWKLEEALRAAARRPEDLVLLGITPDGPDPTLGWIVPSPEHDGVSCGVLAFEEKPEPARAARLMAAGALWNGMLIAARASGLVRLYRDLLPELIDPAEDGARPRRDAGARSQVAAYQAMPIRDFSRDLLARAVTRLRLVRVPPCGWTDLGTPVRLLRWQASQHAVFSTPTARSA